MKRMTRNEAVEWGKKAAAKLAKKNPQLKSLAKKFDLRLDLKAIQQDV